MLRIFTYVFLAALCASACPARADSAAVAGALSVQQVGDIHFVTGGFGEEEKAALEAVKSEYNLHILSAGAGGAYAGDTHISIQNPKGEALLAADAGPFFYAQLPAGRYVVEASSSGQTQRRNINVAAKTPSRVTFIWK